MTYDTSMASVILLCRSCCVVHYLIPNPTFYRALTGQWFYVTPLQVTAQISEKTGHLPGVAIAIMGCIVNGVGEMADADFGYVGGAPGKVTISHLHLSPLRTIRHYRIDSRLDIYCRLRAHVGFVWREAAG